VRFRLEQTVQADPDAAVAAFATPAFYAALGELRAISPPRVVSCDRDDVRQLAHIAVAYAFAGDLSPAVRAVVDPAKLTWVDHSEVDLIARTVRFEMVPDHYQSRFRCEGRYRFVGAGPGRCTQEMSGELSVRYPLVGPVVERAILSGLREQLVAEAAILARWATRGPGAE
jgi:hypothetical protein